MPAQRQATRAATLTAAALRSPAGGTSDPPVEALEVVGCNPCPTGGGTPGRSRPPPLEFLVDASLPLQKKVPGVCLVLVGRTKAIVVRVSVLSVWEAGQEGVAAGTIAVAVAELQDKYLLYLLTFLASRHLDKIHSGAPDPLRFNPHFSPSFYFQTAHRVDTSLCLLPRNTTAQRFRAPAVLVLSHHRSNPPLSLTARSIQYTTCIRPEYTSLPRRPQRDTGPPSTTHSASVPN